MKVKAVQANTPAVSVMRADTSPRWCRVSPKRQLQLGEFFEVVAADVLVRHTNAAVQLHRLLADQHGRHQVSISLATGVYYVFYSW